MIKFKDFVPKKIEKSTIFKKAKFSPLDGTMKDVNEWFGINPAVLIINIETLIMPAPSTKGIDETESKSTNLIPAMGRENYYYYQIVRVWYTED